MKRLFAGTTIIILIIMAMSSLFIIKNTKNAQAAYNIDLIVEDGSISVTNTQYSAVVDFTLCNTGTTTAIGSGWDEMFSIAVNMFGGGIVSSDIKYHKMHSLAGEDDVDISIEFPLGSAWSCVGIYVDWEKEIQEDDESNFFNYNINGYIFGPEDTKSYELPIHNMLDQSTIFENTILFNPPSAANEWEVTYDLETDCSDGSTEYIDIEITAPENISTYPTITILSEDTINEELDQNNIMEILQS